MSAKAIWFEQKEHKFFFNGYPFTQEKLGRLIAGALMTGTEEIEIQFADGERIMTVTVNYVQEMMRFTAKEGWFWDCVQDVADHKFDPNRPTPGSHWGETRELLAEARNYLRDANRLFGSSNPFQRARAYQEQDKGRLLQQFAGERQHPGVSGRGR